MYDGVQERIRGRPRAWLVTGAAGFIGSHLLEALLRLDQHVVGLDNSSLGRRSNLAEVRSAVAESRWERFRFIEGDIRSLDICRDACHPADLVLHHAALGSVPQSISDPVAAHDSNVTGFLNMLVAARDAGVSRFVYAAVIPAWIAAVIRNEPVYINRDGKTTRDFCYVDNAVQANQLAATVEWYQARLSPSRSLGRAVPGAQAALSGS